MKNLSDYYVSSAREVYEIMRQGGAARVVSSTSEFGNVNFLSKIYTLIAYVFVGRHEC